MLPYSLPTRARSSPIHARPTLLALCALTLVAACGSNKLQSSYDTCKTDLTTAQGQVKTCQSASSDCTANLDTCQSNVGSCSSALTTCQTDVETCQTDLTTAKGDLSNCQGDLSTSQGNLSTCQADLGTAQAKLTSLTAYDADLVSAITAQGVIFANATGYGSTDSYAFAADGTYVEKMTALTCQANGNIGLGNPGTAHGTWSVSGNKVTVVGGALGRHATLMAVKGGNGAVSLVDFAARQLYVHN